MNTFERNIKEYSIHLIRAIVFWTVALAVFAVFRYFGVSHELGLEIDQDLRVIYRMENMIQGYAFCGVLIGVLYATLEFLVNKYLLKYISIGLGAFIQTVLVLAIVIFSSKFVLTIFASIYQVPFDGTMGWWLRDKTFWSLLMYIPFASFVFTLQVIISDRFGKETFFKTFLGYYLRPREENRIFMFLDLKGSTPIAEKIGHIKYSKLLQDCFYDLNEVAPRFKAEIYQYVGDEAVISWPKRKGIANLNCLRLFFEFQEKLDRKASYYEKKYGLKPEFKAGLHGGIVTAVEVGIIKKELAYHGDVVNTTARIQGVCNTYKEHFLVSKRLLNHLDTAAVFRTKDVGEVYLKGKAEMVEVWAVCKEAQKEKIVASIPPTHVSLSVQYVQDMMMTG